MEPRPATTAVTYRYERLRAVATGIVETAGQTFLLLIAVRVLQAGPTAKALISSGQSFGLMLSVLTVVVVAQRAWLPARVAAWLAAFGAGCFALMACWPTVTVFVLAGIGALAGTAMAIPLLTQIYHDNYPATQRGRLFARAIIIRVAFAAVFSEAAGRFLTGDLSGRYRWLLVVYAAGLAFASYCLARVPSQPLTPTASLHPLRAMRFVQSDPVFRLTLISWMFMGFANLMMLPLRVEYLANPRYGLTLSTGMVALLVGVIPNAARLVMSPVWGWAFDRLNFFALRVTLNMGFAVGIVAFFSSDSMFGLVLGAVVFGIGLAGGDVAWNLWVTKFAPPERVADYMSVHTFFTGLRGLVAPLVAFHLAAHVSLPVMGGISAAMILVASAILFREVKLGKSPDPGTELVEQSARANGP
jgi:MFS family permease